MAYGFARRSFQSGSLMGTGRHTQLHKRRSTAVRKIYKKKPTARTQQKQIARVTKLAIENKKRFNSVYTDWSISPTSDSDVGYGFTLISGSWQTIRLTNFDQWQPVLRQSENVNESNHTWVKRISVNLRAYVTSGYATANFFVIRTRYPEATRDLFNNPPTIPNGDYIDNSQYPGACIRLNPAKFKILGSKYMTLKVTPQSVTPNDPAFIPGDPVPAERKWQWNFEPNLKVHQSSFTGGGAGTIAGKWTQKAFEDLPYYDRIYLMAYIHFDPTTTRGSWYADSLATCVNTL